jgi:hypothetical protein
MLGAPDLGLCGLVDLQSRKWARRIALGRGGNHGRGVPGDSISYSSPSNRIEAGLGLSGVLVGVGRWRGSLASVHPRSSAAATSGSMEVRSMWLIKPRVLSSMSGSWVRVSTGAEARLSSPGVSSNPRLQRTRSALLRSPLSRKPLDGPRFLWARAGTVDCGRGLRVGC